MKKLTKYQKRIIKRLLSGGEWIKYSSDRFYLVEWKRGKEIKTLLGDSIIELIIESSNSFAINIDKGIFGGRLVQYKLSEYLLKTE